MKAGAVPDEGYGPARDVRGGVPQGAATRVSDEPDRHTAIFSAINEAGPDDIVDAATRAFDRLGHN